MQKTIFLLCGPAGSGKSTFISRQLERHPEGKVALSRDIIRFSLLEKDEDYFAHEDEVFELFIKAINNALRVENNKEIYVDATHLTEKARNKVLDLLELDSCRVIPVVVHPNLKTTLAQNEQREGRAFVPRSVIKRMDAQFQEPTFNEKHHYAEIWKVVKDGILVIPNNGGNKND